jgi:hypothetical protein
MRAALCNLSFAGAYGRHLSMVQGIIAIICSARLCLIATTPRSSALRWRLLAAAFQAPRAGRMAIPPMC